jgi:hypothetical protein
MSLCGCAWAPFTEDTEKKRPERNAGESRQGNEGIEEAKETKKESEGLRYQ